MKRKPWADRRGAKRTAWRDFMTEAERAVVADLEMAIAEHKNDLAFDSNMLRLIRNRCCTRQNRAS